MKFLHRPDSVLVRDTVLGIALSSAVLAASPALSGLIGAGTDLFVGHGLVAMGLLTGLAAGFSTCMATVGGIALALSADRRGAGKPAFDVHAFFHLGRVAAFSAAGFALASAGSAIADSDAFFAAMTAITALVLFRLGLALVGWFPTLKAFHLPFSSNASRASAGPFALGAMTILLPCGFTLAMELAVARSGESVFGALAMLAFAIGTLPGLALLGAFAAWEGEGRKSVLRVSGWLILAFSAIAAASAWNSFHLVSHSPAPAAVSSGTGSLSAESPVAAADVFEARIVQDGRGYSPSSLTLPKGRKIRLTVVSENPFTCASDFSVPDFGIRKLLDSGENVFEFETPAEAKKIWFGCGMRMYQGEFRVE